ncbi:hypothetical protein DYB31_008298 [Aphanomyces astaci]|uniref:Uncharacterized protein n=1 Tax=Aphanomyces astaci TaxID=112090 RepID=A0A397EJX7_APHAT|nr:hypothetical protein DYB31_008298 [Aphanomyces astaci]
MLRELQVWVDETAAPVELTLDLLVMQKLGYNEQKLLENALALHRTLLLSDGIDDDEGMACATPELRNAPDDDGPVHIFLETKVAEAATAVMPTFGRDPPVKVEPLKVRLKEGAVPVKSGLRRYPPTHMTFLEKHVWELERAGLVYRNTRSRCASAPRIVPKKDPGGQDDDKNNRGEKTSCATASFS